MSGSIPTTAGRSSSSPAAITHSREPREKRLPPPTHELGFANRLALSQLSRRARIACAHLVKERSALFLHTLSSVEVHSGRPCLPISAAGLTGLRLNPLVETPLRLVLVPRLDQPGQRQQLALRQVHLARRYACRHIEPANKWPHSPVVIVAGPVISLVSRQPICVTGQDIRKQTGRQIHGKFSATPHGLALGFNPCHQVSCPLRQSNSRQNRQAVAQQIETVAAHDLVGVK